VRLGVVTSAGPEPEAQDGLAELRRLAAFVEASPHQMSTSFRHRETEVGRRLWLERVGNSVVLAPGARDRVITHAVLYAPVSAEIGAPALGVWDDVWSRGAILQGWLRTTLEASEVEPLPLAAVEAPIVAALRGFDVLVASREDLVAEAATPWDQLTNLRAVFGRIPALVVTDGIDGVWLDVTHVRPSLDRREHLAVPWRVDSSSTIGAGDILAALLTMEDADPPATWIERAIKGMRVVAEELEARRRPA
jgi:hypothetical protein